MINILHIGKIELVTMCCYLPELGCYFVFNLTWKSGMVRITMHLPWEEELLLGKMFGLCHCAQYTTTEYTFHNGWKKDSTTNYGPW